MNNLIGKGQTEKHGPAMPGEQMRSVITSDKLKKIWLAAFNRN